MSLHFPSLSKRTILAAATAFTIIIAITALPVNAGPGGSDGPGASSEGGPGNISKPKVVPGANKPTRKQYEKFKADHKQGLNYRLKGGYNVNLANGFDWLFTYIARYDDDLAFKVFQAISKINHKSATKRDLFAASIMLEREIKRLTRLRKLAEKLGSTTKARILFGMDEVLLDYKIRIDQVLRNEINKSSGD